MNKIWLKKIFGDPRNFGGSDLTNELKCEENENTYGLRFIFQRIFLTTNLQKLNLFIHSYVL